MKNIVCKLYFILLCAIVLTVSSCVGASADITINANGSGTIALEYRVSQMLEEIGRLDGNESSPAIPVGKKDFQRTIARIPGLSLSSYSSKEAPRPMGAGGKDMVIKAVLKFKNTDALLTFFDTTGTRATLVQRDGKNALRLVLLDPSDEVVDDDLRSLVQEISSGYGISFNFTLSKDATLSLLTLSTQDSRVVSQGKKVAFSTSLNDLFADGNAFKTGLAIEVVW